MNLGTIKGKPILSIGIEGEEQGYMQDAKDYNDAYYLIKVFKYQDKMEKIKDNYTLILETEDGYYSGYKIRKSKKGFIIK